MLSLKQCVCWLVLMLGMIRSVSALPNRTDIPAPLLPWIPWVLSEQPTAACPFWHEQSDTRTCVWPGALTLTLEAAGGRFAQTWTVYQAGWVSLPGDMVRWPQQVTNQGQPVAVTASAVGTPQVWLPAGNHQLAGEWRWARVPEVLPVARDVGLLTVQLNGQVMPFPHRDADGQLWLQEAETAASEEDQLDLKVYRRLTDDVPLRLTTQLVVNAAGKSREVVLPTVLPAGFLPQSVQSPLPVRLDADGQLRMQVRAGSWRLSLEAYAPQPLENIAVPESGNDWPTEEVWVFQANPHLRHVTLAGVDTVDPQQTTLSDEWKRLPAYRVLPGALVQLQEAQRGMARVADQLTLAREWWLDADGTGFTVHDLLTGRFRSGTRLEVRSPMELGRVAAGGKGQFITAFADGTHQGVEVRNGDLRVEADSRLPNRAHLTAVGWAHDFQSVSARLHLPPGWRLFAASGVDSVSDSWVTRWNLLDLFLLLIVTLAMAKLWGPVWGGIALVVLAVTLPERGSPQWIWVALVAGVAALQVVTAERARWWLQRYFWLVWGALLLTTLPFLVQQARVALYPVLERPGQAQYVEQASREADEDAWQQNEINAPAGATAGAMAEDSPEIEPNDVQQQSAPIQRKIVHGMIPSSNSTGGKSAAKKKALMEYRPGTNVQTGPGLPRWQWRTVQLRWSGPVQADQPIHFYYWSPTVNLLLAAVRIVGLLLLLVVSLGNVRCAWPGWLRPRCAGLVLLLLGLGVASPPVWSADEAPATPLFPSAELLDELQGRLLELPPCAPNECVSISQLHLETVAQQLRVTFTANAVAQTAIPLPGSAQEWHATRVTMGGAAAAGVVQDAQGQYWLALTPGVHQIVAEGPLSGGESVRIALPLKPHRVTAAVPGWTLNGVRADGAVEDSVELTRVLTAAAAGGASASNTAATNIAPFVRVERTVRLGLEWFVETRVVRETPLGTAFGFDLPLLPGEAVTSSDVQVTGGVAHVTMGPQVESITWEAVLPEADTVILHAAEAKNSHEIWRVDASPVWHIDATGIPMTPGANEADGPLLWHPWPGESVTLQVSRPEGVAGQTLTVDYSALTATPGRRVGEYRLAFGLRSSLGGQHAVTLPEGATAQSLAVNGTEQPLRQEGRAVHLPLVPGTQQIALTWREPQGVRLWYQVPQIDLGVPSVNAQTEIALPANRWTLLVGGPAIGPAVVFWGYLAVVALLAVGLSRVPWVPLSLTQWLLLGIGLSQADAQSALLIVGAFVALGWRQQYVRAATPRFNWIQLGLVALVLMAMSALLDTIHAGLLGQPEMQIMGNGSSAELLRWMQDRSGTTLPTPWVFSVSLWWYRLAMLGWALWLARSPIGWSQWAWRCFSTGGTWLPRAPKAPAGKAAGTTTP